MLTRTGLATLPLPDGIEFVAPENFVERRSAVAQLGSGHPGLVTVGVAIGDDGFQLPTYDFDDAPVQAGYGGQDLAAALSQIQLYGGDLRMWLRWPDDPAQHHRVETELATLAETTGATVWVPAAGGEAVLLPGCRDLGARDRFGNVTRWQEYRPPDTRGQPRFTTDLDGRLAPTAGPTAGTIGAVTMVSTRRRSPTALRSRYAGLTAEAGRALVDLSLLDDGRLALWYGDGSRLAVAGGVLRALLTSLAWAGEDLLLLTPVPPDAADGLSAHLAAVESVLRVEFWSLPPGASVVVRDGRVRAVDEQRRPAAWLRTGRPGPAPEGSRWYSDDGYLLPVRCGTGRPTVPAPLPQPALVPPPAPAVAAPRPRRVLPEPNRYRVAASSRRAGVGHGVRWVPDRPPTNAEPVRLWVSCPVPPGRALVEGIPTANLFLVGDVDGARVARANPGSYLLCLGADAGSAIALSQVRKIPDEVRLRLRDASDGDGGDGGDGGSSGSSGSDTTGRFLLPAAWLDRVRLLAGYQVDDDGRPHGHVQLPGVPVPLNYTGAGHGVDGLPDEVVRWPAGRRAGHAWVVLPQTPAAPDGDVLHASRQRPAVRAGHRLVRVRLDAGTAIDVPASAAALAGLVSVRSRLSDLLLGGAELVLPSASYDHARVDQVWYAVGDQWQHRARRVGLPLSALFESDPLVESDPLR
ncbi:hypothetical protein EDC02_5237 [Micromonospora sp. Llam0]|nr:hypothetical protein EDC02_5237 [Micromonospora sp. Llam0]